MDLKEHWTTRTAPEKRAIAEAIGVSTGYIRLVAHGHRQFSGTIARKYHEASGKRVPLSKIRPDLYPAPKEKG